MSKDESLDFLLSKIKQNRKEGKSGVKDTSLSLESDHLKLGDQKGSSEQKQALPTPAQPVNVSQLGSEIKSEQHTESLDLVLAPPPHSVLPQQNIKRDIKVQLAQSQDSSNNKIHLFSLGKQKLAASGNNTSLPQRAHQNTQTQTSTPVQLTIIGDQEQQVQKPESEMNKLSGPVDTQLNLVQRPTHKQLDNKHPLQEPAQQKTTALTLENTTEDSTYICTDSQRRPTTSQVISETNPQSHLEPDKKHELILELLKPTVDISKTRIQQGPQQNSSPQHQRKGKSTDSIQTGSIQPTPPKQRLSLKRQLKELSKLKSIQATLTFCFEQLTQLTQLKRSHSLDEQTKWRLQVIKQTLR